MPHDGQRRPEPVTEKPPVHVTEHGVSYVRVDDLVRSRAFWREVERTRRAIYAGEPELFEPEERDDD